MQIIHFSLAVASVRLAYSLEMVPWHRDIRMLLNSTDLDLFFLICLYTCTCILPFPVLLMCSGFLLDLQPQRIAVANAACPCEAQHTEELIVATASYEKC